MKLDFNSFNRTFDLYLRGNMTYQVELGTDTFGNITRINNALADLPKRLEGAKSQLETLYSQQGAAKQELEKPFTLAEELAEKESRLALLNTKLNIDGGDELWAGDNFIEQETAAKSAKPSLMDGIRSRNLSDSDKRSPSPGKSTEHNI